MSHRSDSSHPMSHPASHDASDADAIGHGIARIAPDRRGFLKGLVGAGAFLLGVRAGVIAAPAPSDGPGDPNAAFAPNVWLAIDADDTVRIIAHRSEMGTGIRTVLPLVVADELGCSRGKVQVVQAIGDEKYGSQDTDGSRSIRRFYEPMRVAGATAALMLRRAAAARWKVPVEQTRTADHAVHGPGGKRLGFGALAADAAKLPLPAKADLVFKKPAERRFVGADAPIEDIRGIVDGSAVFGADVRRPGMRFAMIARPPVLGQPVKAVNDAAARAVKGVSDVIRIPPFEGSHAFQPLGGVAVIARDTWSALQGRRALEITWGQSPHTALDDGALPERLGRIVQQPGKVLRARGDVTAAQKSAAKTHSATYHTARLAHASMEPPVATAEWQGDRCTVWAPTQNPQAARDEVARMCGVAKDRVTVNVTLLGGGFGRKSKPDFVAEAAWLAKRVKAPVQVVWTREDDLAHDYYHAPAAVHLEAGLDGKNAPLYWLQRSAFPTITSTFNREATAPSPMEMGLGFTDVPWAVPHLRAEGGEVEHHARIGWYRAVCNIWHAFAVHGFADELAHAAGADPLAFLRDLIGPKRLVDPTKEGCTYPNYGEPLAKYPIDTGRLRRVLDSAADGIGWGRETAKGSGLGIAVHRSFLTYVAAACEVSVDERGRVRIPRFVIAVDCGLAVNPDRVRAQMEGSVVFGVSLALHSAITHGEGRPQQSNFHDYRIARLTDAPRRIEVRVVGDGEHAPTGVGEPGVPPIAPALANAIFAATGKRLRRLPMTATDLREG